MKPNSDQHNDFFAHMPLPGVTFEHNEAIEIIGGDHAGEFGSIISVELLGDDPSYLVELGSGRDVVISQSLLRTAEA